MKRADRRLGALIELHPDWAIRRPASRPTVGRWVSYQSLRGTMTVREVRALAHGIGSAFGPRYWR